MLTKHFRTEPFTFNTQPGWTASVEARKCRESNRKDGSSDKLASRKKQVVDRQSKLVEPSKVGLKGRRRGEIRVHLTRKKEERAGGRELSGLGFGPLSGPGLGPNPA
ncbi:hypothetical protein CRG98_005864 [Punica granatum]|uniref:Uncharacterized protein n=1 Tax=Punica granatum TaxID=22663 RepID=A0A2I0KZ31_PUNGR|nr:hypothetical protein CRG98_005864 [Punica granatum]